jgi:hypothetical protein
MPNKLKSTNNKTNYSSTGWQGQWWAKTTTGLLLHQISKENNLLITSSIFSFSFLLIIGINNQWLSTNFFV